MINNINRLHPPYAQFIKNSVAAMNSDSLLNQREREIIRLSSLITVGASLVQVKNTIRMMLKRNIFSKNEIGEIIMQTFNLKPGKNVGILKDAIRNAILDGEVENDYTKAFDFMLIKANELGIVPFNS